MRRTPLRRETRLVRHAPIRRANEDRLAARRAEQFGPCARMARRMGCCVPGCEAAPPRDRIDAAHVRSRGAGGRDAGNVIPLCRRHHAEQHRRGVLTWQYERRVDMRAEAERVARLVAAHECAEWPEQSTAGCRCAICWRAIGDPEVES
jgi:hypothetical protein